MRIDVRGFSVVLPFWLLIAALVTNAQEERQIPSDLIRRLTNQVGRTPGPIGQLGIFTCGSYYAESGENRVLARALVSLGAASIPHLDAAFDAIEDRGLRSPFAENAVWMFFAYAKIEGTSAYARLRNMASDPKLVSLQAGLDASIALSLGLTSYVSDSRKMSSGVVCRNEQPRDALDRLFLAWEKDDRRSFEAQLGPSARAALKALLNGTTWAEVRTDYWRGKRAHGIALKYRVDTPGPWSEPPETLEDKVEGIAATPAQPAEFRLNVHLRSGPGVECGDRAVVFVRTASGETSIGRYLIDNSDIASLLRAMTTCAM
jgi:hypothetical protein